MLFYSDKIGKEPFVEWLESLSEKTQTRIRHRLTRVEQGNLGDYKPIEDGISELSLSFGKGYRIYFGEVGATIVVLLSGGDKGSQKRDIKKAKLYWKDFKERYDEDQDEL